MKDRTRDIAEGKRPYIMLVEQDEAYASGMMERLVYMTPEDYEHLTDATYPIFMAKISDRVDTLVDWVNS